jgi:hypothetical protein
LAEYPYFKDTGDNFVSFLYISFKRNKKTSELEGKEILDPEYIGFAFDFKEKLIIASTASTSKSSLIESAFEPVENLCEVNDYRYSGDFLFWLVYMNDIYNGEVTPDIKINRITSISSERKNWNLSEALSASVNVTDVTEARVILGLNKVANAIKMKFNAYNEIYDISLTSDGRFRAKQGKKLSTKVDKANYAKDIHNIIQEIYEAYNNAITLIEWDTIKENYCENLLKKGNEDLNQCLYKSGTKPQNCISKYHILVINQSF